MTKTSHHNQYIRKEDENVLYSIGHLDTIFKLSYQASSAAKVKKKLRNPKKLTKVEVAEIIIKTNMKTRTELLQHANWLLRRGNITLYPFCIEKSTKTLVDFISNVWDTEIADKMQERKPLSRVEFLPKALDSPCECNRAWLKCALELLESNSID